MTETWQYVAGAMIAFVIYGLRQIHRPLLNRASFLRWLIVSTLYSMLLLANLLERIMPHLTVGMLGGMVGWGLLLCGLVYLARVWGAGMLKFALVIPALILIIVQLAHQERHMIGGALNIVALGMGGWWLLLGPWGCYFSLASGPWLGLAAGLVVLHAQRLRKFIFSGIGQWSIPIVICAVFFLSVSESGHLKPRDPCGRWNIWAVALQMIIERPAFGWGPGAFAERWAPRAQVFHCDPYSHAHNLYLNVAVEEGIIGLAVSAWLTVFVIKELQKRGQGAIGALAAICSMLVHGLADTPTTRPYLVFALAVVVACALAGPVTRPQSDEQKPKEIHRR